MKNLENQLTKCIKDEASKLIERFHQYHNIQHLEFLRNCKRFYPPPKKAIHQPSSWSKDKKYNPFYVQRNHVAIAKSIAKKISQKIYVPHTPDIVEIPKHGGGARQVSVYQIPDAAISRMYYYRLFNKNKHRFSSFSYAYRNDRNVHFAIQDIWLDISRDSRSFVAEFDFSDFFGSIEHAYLFKQFDRNGFFVSDEECHIIKAFLGNRKKGIPQGTSISLFLANLACWELDSQLEKLGVKFARYADDTVIWASSYSSICDAYTVINNFSKVAGIPINFKKSDGISLLSKKEAPAELASSKSSVDFLGYTLSVDHISIKKDSIGKIKKQISYILYRNLIQPLRRKPWSAISMPANDKDEGLLTAMMQIRRYMYGGLASSQIEAYLKGQAKRLYFKGIMSFYPLVNDIQQLRELDGWLVSVIYRSVRLRGKILHAEGYNRHSQFPFNVSKNNIVMSFSAQVVHGKNLYSVPSFILIYKAIKKGLIDKGVGGVMHPSSTLYMSG